MIARAPSESVILKRVRPSLSLSILVLLLPLQGIGVDIGIILSLDLLAAALFVLVNLRYLSLSRLGKDDGFFVLFLVWALLSLLVSMIIFPELQGVQGAEALRYSLLRAPIHWARLVFYFLLFVTFRNFLISHEVHLSRFFKLVLVISAVLAAYGVYQYLALTWDLPGANFRTVRDPFVIGSKPLGIEGERFKRLFGFSEEPENYGSLLVTLIALVLASFYYQVARRRDGTLEARRTFVPTRVYIGLVGILLLNLLLTFSRSSILVFTVGIGLAVLVRLFRWRPVIGIGILAVILLVLIQQILGTSIPIFSFASEFAIWQRSDISLDARVFALGNSAAAILVNPIIGIGLGGEAAYSYLYWYGGEGAVSGLFGFWPYIGMGTGVIGLALLAVFIIRQGVRLVFPRRVDLWWRQVSRTIAFGLLMVAAQFLTLNGGLYPYFWIMLAAGAAVGHYGRASRLRRETLAEISR